MKKFISIIISLSLCLSLAACGGNTTPNDSTESTDNVVSTETSSTVTEETDGDAALPMNIGEAYSCNIGGYEGYVAVTNYETMPDEMNEGCEIRTAHITAVFPGAPKNLEITASVFPASGAPSAIDETAWLLETEYGDILIFEYDNLSTAMMDGENLRYDIILSYMVPSDYDEVAFAVTDGSFGSGLDVVAKSDIVFSDTLWFVMGSMNNGVLTYNGNAVATAPATADMNQIFGQSGSSNWADNNVSEDEYYEESETPSSAGFRTLTPIQAGSITSATADGRSLAFADITLVECYEDTNVINVTVNYSGHQNGDVIRALMYDAYNEVHLEEQNHTVSGSGSDIFTFSAPAATAPYTFSLITLHNGNYVQNNIHIDVDVY